MSSNDPLAGLDPGSLSAEEFAQMVATASDAQLAEVMQGPERERALREIFGRMAEHFDPSRAPAEETVVHFQILDRPDGGRDEFEVVLANGECKISEAPSADPRVTIAVGPVDFLKLITNQASGPGLFMTGKLKLQGDLMFATQITSFFRIPTATTQKGTTN